jgi:hypothetical protein
VGFMRKASQRLRREGWEDLQEAMDEVWSVFQSDEPFTVDGQLIVNNNTPDAGIVINNTGDTNTAITINNYPTDGGPDAPLDPGDTFITNIYIDGTIEGFPNPPPQPEPTQPGTGETVVAGGGGFPGRVISGSGSTYQVAVYESGLSGAPTTRTVTQLQIAEGEAVPAGTWAIVGKVGASYFMQVPVWLEDES